MRILGVSCLASQILKMKVIFFVFSFSRFPLFCLSLILLFLLFLLFVLNGCSGLIFITLISKRNSNSFLLFKSVFILILYNTVPSSWGFKYDLSPVKSYDPLLQIRGVISMTQDLWMTLHWHYFQVYTDPK